MQKEIIYNSSVTLNKTNNKRRRYIREKLCFFFFDDINRVAFCNLKQGFHIFFEQFI